MRKPLVLGLMLVVMCSAMLASSKLPNSVGGFTLDGIGTATFGAIILYHLLNAAAPSPVTREEGRLAPPGAADV